jgi:hypothetical protein
MTVTFQAISNQADKCVALSIDVCRANVFEYVSEYEKQIERWDIDGDYVSPLPSLED